jgi:hypothetical protein
MDPYERARIDRINREAERERARDDPQQPVKPSDSKPLIIMICAALAATVIVLGILWMNNARSGGTGGQPVAEQPSRQ